MSKAPMCINFNGKPGTGKTSFGSYIATKGIFDKVFVYNLVQAEKLDFPTILTSFENKLNQQSGKDKNINSEPETVLLIFDEIDKWLRSHIDYKIDEFRNQSRKTTETVGKNNEKTVESYEKLTEKEEQEKRIQIHKQFLTKLYSLCDGQCLKNNVKYVIIFNTNHFDKLFEGMGEEFEATKDRFRQYTFINNNKTDIINITKDIRMKLKIKIDKKNNNTTDVPEIIGLDEINNDTIDVDGIIDFDETLYNEIPNDIQITCRTLFKKVTDNSFNMPKIIDALKKYHDEKVKKSEPVIEIFNDI
jgi:hypothetical protein